MGISLVMWTRIIDLSVSFKTEDIEGAPVKYIERTTDALEISSGALWAWDGMLYQVGGFHEPCDQSYPGYTPWDPKVGNQVWRYVGFWHAIWAIISKTRGS